MGDIVVVCRPPVHTGQPTKTQANYWGPVVIDEVSPNDTYHVTQLSQPSKRSYRTTVHADQLKLQHAARKMDDVDESDCDDSFDLE